MNIVKINYVKYVSVIFIISISCFLIARDAVEDVYMPLIKTKKNFEYVLQKYPFVIAYVYDLPRDIAQSSPTSINGQEVRVHADAYKNIDRIYNLIQQYVESNVQRYQAAGVKYIGINRTRGDVRYVDDRYKLDKHTSYLLFFHNGALITTYVVTHDFSYTTLQSFISKTNVEDFIADELASKAREAARQEEQEELEYKKRRRRYYSSYYNNGPVVGVGFGYGYSYPYYGPYWGAPYGGYWGGPYYAPGFGISFAV